MGRQCFLRALYYLFKDFLTRRADYTHYTQSSTFPLKFCSIRWLENSSVLKRAVEMLDHLVKYLKAVEKNLRSWTVFEKISRESIPRSKI